MYMKTIGVMQNTIQEYPWGSFSAIPELLGMPAPSDRPQAALWMGAHPKASSLGMVDGHTRSLKDLIEKYPEDVLGKSTAKRFGNRLPYLFKVLAAAKPLSIQAHPNLTQAVCGFERENDANISLDSPQRNYKDDNHKPECICAVTDFWALNGFRKISDIISRLELCGSMLLEKALEKLHRVSDSAGLKHFFGVLMTLDTESRQQILEHALGKAEKHINDDPSYEWMLKLHEEYPGDIGVLSPLILNLVCLEPGQAMFLPAGEFHSYLDGTGIELMANSDNVLRGGLTPKHVDVPELLNVLNFEERELEILSPQKIRDYEVEYDSRADEFVLSVICLPGEKMYNSPLTRSVEILLCTAGKARITMSGEDDPIDIKKGDSVLVPSAVKQYHICGETTLYKAAVPLA